MSSEFQPIGGDAMCYPEQATCDIVTSHGKNTVILTAITPSAKTWLNNLTGRSDGQFTDFYESNKAYDIVVRAGKAGLSVT